MYKLTFYLYTNNEKCIQSKRDIEYDIAFEKIYYHKVTDTKRCLKLFYKIYTDKIIENHINKSLLLYLRDVKKLNSNKLTKEKIQNIMTSKIISHYKKEKFLFELFLFFRQQKINNLYIKNNYKDVFLQRMNSSKSTYLILGATGSGKNTLAQYLVREYGYFHLDASDFMRYKYYKSVKHPDDDFDTFVENILKQNPNIVPKEILKLKKRFKEIPLVISGLRTITEIAYLLKNIQESLHFLYILAQQKNRFSRCIERERSDVLYNWNDFVKKDIYQYEKGIKYIEKLSKHKINNDGDKNELFNISSRYLINISTSHAYKKNIAQKNIYTLNREQLCILALNFYKNKYLSSDEIVTIIDSKLIKLSNNHKKKIYKFLTNKILPFYKIKIVNKKERYKINSSGESYAKYILENINHSI